MVRSTEDNDSRAYLRSSQLNCRTSTADVPILLVSKATRPLTVEHSAAESITDYHPHLPILDGHPSHPAPPYAQCSYALSRIRPTLDTMKHTTDIDQRWALMPKIVKTLASLKQQEAHERSTTDQLQFQEHLQWPYGSPEWIEDKLWLSFNQVLGSITRTRTARGPQEPRSMWSEALPNSYCKKLSSNLTDVKARIGIQAEVSLNPLCHVSSSLVDIAKSSQRMITPATADESCTNSLGNMNTNSTWNAGANTLDARIMGDTRHAHHTYSFMQPTDKALEIDMLEDMIGQERLIHDLQSTFSNWHDQNSDEQECIDIYGDFQPSEILMKQDLSIGTSNREQNSFYTNQFIKDTSSSPTFTATPNAMASQDSMQSLSELLGDDSRLGNMWKRRRSTCPLGDDDAEQLHNMFLHDPDMKLFSPTRKDSSFADAMLFDNYDFSRSSSRSSTATTSRSSFDQLEPSPYASSTPSSSKKHSSSRKQSSRSRMSEDSILYQQTGASRSIDIKQRKNPREYSSRH